MPMYNLLQHKKSANLWQYCSDDDGIINSKLFQFKSIITDNTNNTGTAKVKIVVPSKYLSNFWRTLEMPLIKCEVLLYLNWSENCVICEADRTTKLILISTKRYVPVVTL